MKHQNKFNSRFIEVFQIQCRIDRPTRIIGYLTATRRFKANKNFNSGILLISRSFFISYNEKFDNIRLLEGAEEDYYSVLKYFRTTFLPPEKPHQISTRVV